MMFTPADVEAATEGRVRQTDIRNWTRDGRFNTPIAEPRAGKPRQMPAAAVYEAALLREFARYGVPLKQAKKWNAQLLTAIAQRGMQVMEPSGSQAGGNLGSPQLVVFDPDSDKLYLVREAGAQHDVSHSRDELLFFKLRNANGAAAVPGSLAVIHLPALLSPIKRRLGITE